MVASQTLGTTRLRSKLASQISSVCVHVRVLLSQQIGLAISVTLQLSLLPGDIEWPE